MVFALEGLNFIKDPLPHLSCERSNLFESIRMTRKKIDLVESHYFPMALCRKDELKERAHKRRNIASSLYAPACTYDEALLYERGDSRSVMAFIRKIFLSLRNIFLRCLNRNGLC